MKIAILTPLKKEEAETFIQNHIAQLPFEKIVIYGGSLPYLAHNHQPTILQRRKFRLLQFIRKKLGLKKKRFEEVHLSSILKKEKVDVIFAEYLITGAETLEVCKKLNIPLISIALGYEISKYDIIERYKIKYKALFKYASTILVVSEHMKVSLEALDCPDSKIIFSPAAPDKTFFKVKPHFFTKQVLAVGRFVEKKAPHLTILAFHKVLKKVPDAKLVMAGEGALLNVCKDLVKVLKIEYSVNFIGKITTEQHIELLEQSMLFVQHSKVAETGDSEGTPVAILEASAAGLPVVSTLHAGIPRVVIQEKTGFLVEEYNIDLMADRIIQLLSNLELNKELGNNGREYIKANFTLEKHIMIIADCIEKVMK